MSTAPPAAAVTPALLLDAQARCRANLDALAVRQPELAAQLAARPWPPGARIVAGRDGAPVAVRTSADATWLGGTSMPTISAPEVLRTPMDPAVSVALASVGSGYEPPLLARRLAPHAAVFACAADIEHLVLALHAADWSDALRRGSLVLLAGDAEAALVEFVEKNPGYQLPARVQSLPDVAAHDFAERAAAIQRGVQRADAGQQRLVGRLAEQVARRPRRRGGPQPRVLVLSVDAVGGGCTFAAHLENAGTALGFDVRRCVPDAPERCHRVARLTALRDHDPDWVLFVNGTPGGLRECWPPGLPCACWFLESGSLPAAALTGLADCENLYAASSAVDAQLRARGASAVTVLEPGVDDTVFRPLDPAERAGAAACAIAVIQDGCDLAPAASNIGLESHERLWKAAADLLTEDLARRRPAGRAKRTATADAGRELLTRAERATGVTLSDPGLRGEFATLLAARLIGTVTAREVVSALEPVGSLGLWGTGWGAYPHLQGIHRGLLPAAADRNRIYQDAAVVIFPQVGPMAVQGVLDALAAGGCPIIARPPEETLAQYPDAGRVLTAVPAFRSLPDLVKLVRKLISDTACRQQTAEAARAQVRGVLTLRRRIQWLHEKLTGVLVPGPTDGAP